MLIAVIKGVCMKIFWMVLISFILLIPRANAQYSAQNDAMYLGTLKAVIDYKIADEENIKNIEELRSNKRFMLELRKMMDKLSNRRNKNATNTRVYKILIKAGKDIYNELN